MDAVAATGDCGELGARVQTKRLFPLRLQHELDRLTKIKKAFVFGFPLTIGAGYFKACGPEPAFVWLCSVKNGREPLHLHHDILTVLTPSPAGG